MPRPRTNDLFASIRREGQKVLAALQRQIQDREAQLRDLIRQADVWRVALGGKPGPARNGTPRASGRPTAAGAGRGRRVDWDEVLASVPDRFGVEDVIKHPGARAKGRAQIYPALSRWEAAKKIRRVGQGQYEKVSSGQRGARPTQRAAARAPRAARRARGGRRRRAAGAAKSPSGNGRVNWDEVLKSLPDTFGASDVLKNPAASAKGSAQVYPAIGRWVATKKVKKVGKGRYQRI